MFGGGLFLLKANGVAIARMIDYNSGKNITSLFDVG
jgi:hypothetical protein